MIQSVCYFRMIDQQPHVWFRRFLIINTLVIFENFQISSILLGQFQNFQKFTRAIIPNCSHKHVITSTKWLIDMSISKLEQLSYTAQKMKFSIKDFLSKSDQIQSFLRIWSHLLKKSLMEIFIFCAVLCVHQLFRTLSCSTWKTQLHLPNVIWQNPRLKEIWLAGKNILAFFLS